MDESNEKETLILNLLLLLLAGISLAVAGWTVVGNWFKAGTDDLFMVLVCLMLALLFVINPAIWAYSNGWLRNPLKKDDEAEAGEAAEAAGHSEHAVEAIAHEARGGSNRQNTFIWAWLLVLTAVEVFLAYIHLNLTLMLLILMGLSLVKAALIVAYFMHLKFERMSLILTIVPTLIVLYCLFAVLFPDSFRIVNMR